MFQEQGKNEDALEWYGKALTIREKVLGFEHPDTASMYNNIATVYLNQKDYDSALDLFCRAVIVMSLCRLDKHPDMEKYTDAMCDCYELSSHKDFDFTSWFVERAETYPSWCITND